MATKAYNVPGGLYSGDAFAAFEGSAYGSCAASEADLLVSAGSGMAVTIAKGQGLIKSSVQTYRFGIDANYTLNIAAASTSPRIDSIVAYIDTSVTPSISVTDNTDAGVLKFADVQGTAASTPVAPTASMIQSAIGAGNPYVILSDITIPARATAASSFTYTRKISSLGADTTKLLADVAHINNYFTFSNTGTLDAQVSEGTGTLAWGSCEYSVNADGSAGMLSYSCRVNNGTNFQLIFRGTPFRPTANITINYGGVLQVNAGQAASYIGSPIMTVKTNGDITLGVSGSTGTNRLMSTPIFIVARDI